MKADPEQVAQQYKLCCNMEQYLLKISNHLQQKYQQAGSSWNDKYYDVLGDILTVCGVSLHKAAEGLHGTSLKVQEVYQALIEYESVHLSGSGGGNGSGSSSGSSGDLSGSSSGGTTPSQSFSSREAVVAAGRSWSDGLSSDEREALQAYTGSAYYNINATLRGLSDSFAPGNENRAALLHQSLSRASIPCDCTVYRGASSAALGEYQHMPDSALIGAVIQDDGFMSTSLSADDAFSGAVQLEIQVPAGSHGAYVGYVGSLGHEESEVLLDAGQQILITGVRRGQYGERIITGRLIN